MSEEVKYSGFCAMVEGNKRQWKGYSYVTSKEVECSKFCGIVEGGGKSIPVSRLKR